jgi:hypothetical protein
MNELTISEANRLTELECQMEQDQAAFVRYGNALLEIRESRLYRQSHPTFEDYCRERWQMTKSRANELIRSSKVAFNLVEISTIQPNEAQAATLEQLEPGQQREVWQKAVATAPEGRVTAAHVQKVREEIAPKSWTAPQPTEQTDDLEKKEAPQSITYNVDDDPTNDYLCGVNERTDRVYDELDKAVGELVARLKKTIRPCDYWMAIETLLNESEMIPAFQSVRDELHAFEQARDEVIREQREREKKERQKAKRAAAKLARASQIQKAASCTLPAPNGDYRFRAQSAAAFS